MRWQCPTALAQAGQGDTLSCYTIRARPPDLPGGNRSKAYERFHVDPEVCRGHVASLLRQSLT